MSRIYSASFILFLASTISGLVPPTDVYSAIIHNVQNIPIQCNIIWSQPSGQAFQSGLVNIDEHSDYYTNEQIIPMEGWQAHAVIQAIYCGQFVLTAPFNGVQSPTTNWEFVVTPNEIISGGSNPYIKNY